MIKAVIFENNAVLILDKEIEREGVTKFVTNMLVKRAKKEMREDARRANELTQKKGGKSKK